MTQEILSSKWNYPTTIHFGNGKIKILSDLCKKSNIRSPLIVTDKNLSNTPIVQTVLNELKNNQLKVNIFDNIQSNPVEKNISDGVTYYQNHHHDGVIALGGGSALDSGKAIAFMVGQSRPLWDFEDIGDFWQRANDQKIAPVIAIPTTAGTGSEVGRASVITDEKIHTKKIIFHPKMMPVAVICDPELTIKLPDFVTAATGMDALAHCLEAYCAPGFHPMADGIAVEGIRLVKENLMLAVKEGHNLKARACMMAAASMGATAFQKGLGAIHALSHPIGAIYNTHHGLTNAVVMPYVLQFNKPAIEEKMIRLSGWLLFPTPSFQSIMDWILKLRKDINIPHTLKELGIEESKLDELAQMAETDPTAGGNPIPIKTKELKQMLVNAWHGNLN
ncbi:MAG: iron-containing alcohol dehydrogenase [Alphaproteobacteria bacterium]|nr:iron-containing alcohol dehydrogenase [Alphaproteobacteria bacterium]